jgi:prepilin-type N-terminal cleavage/methylation domain-containing protein
MTMRGVRRTISRVRGEDRGITLVELIVSMMVLGIAMTIFATTLMTVQTAVVAQDQLTQSNDQARLAIQQIDREMRSGNVLYDPATEGSTTPGGGTGDNYYMVRIYTQTNADDRGYSCVQWRINTSKELQTRWWPPEEPSAASEWRTVAEGIVNREFGVRAFELDSDPLKGGRVLRVTLRTTVDPEATSIQATELQASFTGRNTSYGYPVSVCSPAPSA